MKSIHDFLITPAGNRYNNTKEIEGKTLILNTEMQNHIFVNREAIVLSTPLLGDKSGIGVGHKVLVHHNIFRRFRDVRGVEKNSRAYFDEDTYLCPADQVYMVDKGNGWETLPGFTFVQPIKETRLLQGTTELPLWGIVAYPDPLEKSLKRDDVVAFTPSSEFEFNVDGKKVYRILSYNLTIQNGHKGNQVANNSSWNASS
jgi:hypothetical protein|tara:strand:+ start:652 stop:1254 length:603 start_codon:yes stop_codon:yes gene_type:complete